MSDGNLTKQWLARVRVTNNPAGDLIADMRRDPNIPPLFPNIAAMRDYLHSKSACPGAIAAVPDIWRRYRKWIDRNPCGRGA